MGFSYGSCMVRVGGLLYWRAVVPVRLQEVLGRKEIRRSLRTPYAREARVKVGYLNAKLAGVWKSMDGDSGNLESRFDEILRVKLGQWMIEAEAELLTLKPAQLRQYSEYISDGVADRLGEIEESLAVNDVFMVTDTMEEIITELGVDLDRASPEYHRLSYKLLRASREAVKVRLDKIERGDFLYRPEVMKSVSVTPAVPELVTQHVTPKISLSEAVEAHLKELDDGIVSAGKTGKNGSRDKRHGLREMALIVGQDKPMDALRLEDITAYIVRLQYIPTGLDLSNLTRPLTDYGPAVKVDKPLSPGTQRKRCEDVRRFVGWCQEHGYLSVDTASAIRKKLSGKASDLEYTVSMAGGTPTRAYGLDELRALFESDIYMRWSAKRPGDFWGPLIALFSGMRMGEILTLRAKDIKATPERLDVYTLRKSSSPMKGRDGVLYFDLTDTSVKNLKSKDSYRPIPLHPFLVELGLLDFVKRFEPDEFLFKESLSTNKKANSSEYKFQWRSQYKLTDRFMKLRRSVGVGRVEGATDGDKLDFHCFRNTVVDRLRDLGVGVEVRCEITGHDAADGAGVSQIHGSYSDSFGLDFKLDNGIGLLDFHLSVPALRELAMSPWAKGKK